ncbi:hypothetical protein BHC44_05230 [Snodgrassella alvi]|nr:hypothetical protein BHC44_05230 [Snodgrassella alvi]
MGTLISNAVVLIYAVLFVWQCCKYQLNSWLAASVTVWLVLVNISSEILPGIAGPFKPVNSFLVPVYVLLGSCFVMHQGCKLRNSPYLTVLLYSSRLQIGSLAICLALVLSLSLMNKAALIIPLLVSLLQMLAWQPIFWIGSQWILMMMLFLRGADSEKPIWRWQTLLLFSLFTQLVYMMLSFRGKL